MVLITGRIGESVEREKGGGLMGFMQRVSMDAATRVREKCGEEVWPWDALNGRWLDWGLD
jgi:hypothetical protein